MEARELRRSEYAFKMETRWILAGALLTATLAALCMRLFLEMADSMYLFGGIFTFLIVMGLAWVAILIRSRKWDNTHYVLGEDALLVTRAAGFMGTAQDVYLYESIISATVRQNMMGKKHGFGNIELTIPKLGAQVILNDVEVPDDQLLLIKTHMESKGNRSRELVT